MPGWAPEENALGGAAGSKWSDPRSYGLFEGLPPEMFAEAADHFKGEMGQKELSRFEAADMAGDLLYASPEMFQDMLCTEDGRTGWDAVNEAFDACMFSLDFTEEAMQENRLKRKGLASLLAMAALAPGMQKDPMRWDNREQLAVALSRLLDCGAEHELEDVSVIFLFMMTCFALECYSYTVKVADRLDQEEEDEITVITQTVLGQCLRQLNFPAFTLDCAARARMAWNAFAQNASALRMDAILEEGGDAAAAFEKTCNVFKYLLYLSVETDPEELRKYIRTPVQAAPLYFSHSDFEQDLFHLEYAVSLMPDSLKAAWEPHIGVPPELRDEDDPFEAFSDRKSARISVSDSPGHAGADVQLFSKELLYSYHTISKEAAQMIAKSWLISVLGTIPYFTCIHSLSVCEESQLTSSFSATVADLPQLLADLGYPAQATLQDFHAKLHCTYHRTDTGGSQLRDDILSGWTDCMSLQEEYEQDKDDACTNYMDLGAAAVFVAWPASLEDRAPGDVLTLLKNHLAASKGKQGYRILGEATGTRYRYLDLLLWSPSAVVPALESFFRRIPNGSLARIQLFRRTSLAYPIDYAQLTAGLLPPKTGFVPSTRHSGATGSQKKGKKGKGKRGKK